ncbi:hypothetical protein R1sor_010235 [Riccia sorocarpa]|uniref:Uncharacterized protein n=1 Tax=Riccia sorocarpa TaxID=122646 RepID=A0ABD3HZD5_9MARC
MLACTAQGNLLPSQAIFEGKTRAVVSDGQFATLLKHLGWHLTHSQSHWSTIWTMRDWSCRGLTNVPSNEMFGKYVVEDMAKKLEAGSKLDEVEIETKIVILRGLIYQWLWHAHQDIAVRSQMIQT